LVKLLLDARPEPRSIASPPDPEVPELSGVGLAAQCKPAFEAILADEKNHLPNASDLISDVRKILAAPPFPT
jgi:hypothetical protein